MSFFCVQCLLCECVMFTLNAVTVVFFGVFLVLSELALQYACVLTIAVFITSVFLTVEIKTRLRLFSALFPDLLLMITIVTCVI